jgi:hypothetical protein
MGGRHTGIDIHSGKKASQSSRLGCREFNPIDFPATCRQNGLAPRRSRAKARRLCIRAPILPHKIKAVALILKGAAAE